jgi:hypothetical protein
VEITTASHPDRVPHAKIRIGDAERQSAASRLQDHFAAGRLAWDELDERLGTVWAARTNGDLAGLFADLPADPVPPAEPKPARTQLANWRQRTRVDVRLVLLLVLATCLVVATRGLILLPLLWWRFSGSRRGRYGRPHHSHHDYPFHRSV